MKYYRIKYSLLFIIGFIAFGYSQAKLEIKDAKKNFGFAKKGEVVKVIYEILNTGNAPLILSDIEIGCSCTTAEYDKKPLLPAQASTITIIFDTKTVYDRQDRVVLLHSNDSKSPHKLRYKGVVLK